MACEAWQRVHIDYCGPFLQKYHALVIIDAYSKWPEVFLTDQPNSNFTIRALRKVFSREGAPLVVVSDNGSHFSASCVTKWLQNIGCRHLFTAPRHPRSNGLAENFVGTLKRAIASSSPKSLDELDCSVDNFLLQYRNCAHSSTGETPAKLCKSRALRSNMLGLDTAEVSYFKGNDFRPSTGIVLNNLGKAMVRILDLDDLTVHRRHIDQVLYKDSGQLSNTSNLPIVSNDTSISDSIVSTEEQPGIRRSERLRQLPQKNYRNPQLHSSCSGCDDCTINDI